MGARTIVWGYLEGPGSKMERLPSEPTVAAGVAAETEQDGEMGRHALASPLLYLPTLAVPL